MASENVASDDEINQVTDDLRTERSDLVDGRVWRRLNSVISSDSSGGPVLRTTVKPVKRFRSESSTDKSTNPSPNRKKKLKAALCTSAKIEEVGFVDGKKSISGESGALVFADKTSSSAPDAEKLPPASQVSGKSSLPLKKKRVWEQWSVEDKDFFFEAVAVYGKDFEAIRSAIAQKHRKKGQDSMAKTKNQIRHFYYRTWAMINKRIDADSYPLEINKAFQELYALINYGELRRKLGGNLKKRGLDKLNELIKHGTTSARVKGKNFRIKTPSCRALKKLSPENQAKEGVLDFPLVSDTRRMKIPHSVTVELCPLTMADWNRVHSYAHNPRLRLRVSVDNRLSSLLGYLERKWKPLSERLLSFAQKLAWNDSSNSSKGCGSLVLQTPSDASVNTRIMVFQTQVSSNKVHTIVSYALRKATKTTDKSAREADDKNADTAKEASIIVDDTGGGAVSETEALDSCLSSEDDYDYDSANEDATGIRISKSYQYEDGELVYKDPCYLNTADEFSPQTFNTNFTIKMKDSVVNYNMPDSPNDEAQISLAADDDAKSVADDDDEETTQHLETVNGSKPKSMIRLSEDDPVAKDNGGSVEDCVENAAVDSVSVIEAGPYDHSEQTQGAVDIATVQCVHGSSLSDDAIVNSGDKNGSNLADRQGQESNRNGDYELDLADGRNFGATKFVTKSRTKKKSKSAKNSDFIKAVQTWSIEDSTTTTVAEVFMMLGKPSMFKLCYHWLHDAETEEIKTDSHSIDDGTRSVPSLSTGLAALLEAAGISKQMRANEISEIKKEEAVHACPSTKTASVQCELIKELPKTSEGVTLPVGCTSHSNPHGRGLSKMVCANPTPVAIVQPTSEFVIPTGPAVSRRKVIENDFRRTKVSPQTMNLLLQKERLRNRLMRRPIVVDRSVQNRPFRMSMRPMKTFSIVTQGSKKVGFLPSAMLDVTADESVAKSSQSGSHNTVPVGIQEVVTNENNLLAQAAQEAGVIPCQESSSISSSTSSITTISDTVQADFVTVGVERSGHASNAHKTGVDPPNAFSVPAIHENSTNRIGHVSRPIVMQIADGSDAIFVADVENNLPISESNPLSNSEINPHAPDSSTFPNIEKRLRVRVSSGICSTDNNQPILPLRRIATTSSVDASLTVLEERQSGIDTTGAVDLITDTFQSSNTSDLDAGSDEFVLMTPQKILPDENTQLDDSQHLTPPQMILPSDSEDSFDGILIRQKRRTAGLQQSTQRFGFENSIGLGANRDMISTSADIALDLQLPTLIGENSIDLMSKFQDLVHATDGSALNVLTTDDNARDRPLCEPTFDFSSHS